MQPCVSIVIPIYNAESYLHRCLDSIVAQTLEPIEILCINDASSDASGIILQDYASKDRRIKVVELKKNLGESAARNLGIRIATGEYVGSVDNDDMVDKNFFERLYLLARESFADIVKGNCIEINTNTGDKIYRYINQDVQKNKMCFCYQWWTAIYRREFLLQHHIQFPEELCLGGDIVFLVKALINTNSVGTCDDIHYYYYRREDSGDSNILPSRKIESLISAYAQVFSQLNESYPAHLSDEEFAFFYKWYFTVLTQSIPDRCETAEDRAKCATAAERFFRACKRPAVLRAEERPLASAPMRNLVAEIRNRIKSRMAT